MKNKDDFVIADISLRDLNTLVKNIIEQTGIDNPIEAVKMINSNKATISIISPKWFEEDGIIYFSLVSDGTRGKNWIPRLESLKKGAISKDDKKILSSIYFKPKKPKIYRIAVLKSDLFNDKERTLENIYAYADKKNLLIPNPEVACLIREEFSNKELEGMKLHWIITMHKAIKDHNGDKRLLGTSCGNNGSWFCSYSGNLKNEWNRGGGFAFVFSEDAIT